MSGYVYKIASLAEINIKRNDKKSDLIIEDKALKSLIKKYKLSKKEHDKVLKELQLKIFLNKISEKKPSVLFVIGQPGCGKTTFIQNTNFSNYIIINSDNYRHLNKYYNEILNKYPTYYARLTNFDSHLWGDELFSYAIDNEYSVLREKSPLDYSLIELIKTIPCKYDIVVDIVAVGNLQSLLATRERYEKEILINPNAKLSSIEAHNECYNLLPDFISKCLHIGVKVNYIIPSNNEFKKIAVGEDYLDLLIELRENSNKLACSNYKARMSKIKKTMIKRSASQDQFSELSKIEDIYLRIIESSGINE